MSQTTKDCPECGGVAHRCEPFTRGERQPIDNIGCPANGTSHPAGYWWLCLFCGWRLEDKAEVA